MTPFLAGFADELVKLSATTDPAAQGTGIKAPTAIKAPRQPRPMGPLEPYNAPKFGAPPGLRPPRLPRTALTLPKGPQKRPPNPLRWKRPTVQG